MESYLTTVSPAGVPTLNIDPFEKTFLSDPYGSHSQLRDAGPVVYLESLGIFVMARHAEVSSALQDWKRFCSSRGVGISDFEKEEPWRAKSLLLETDPPVHDHTRAIVNRVVSPQALKMLREKWMAAADELIEGLVARQKFDAITDLAEKFPLTVFAETIGLRDDGRENLLPYATANFNSFGPRNEIYESTRAGFEAATDWIEQSCQRRFLKPNGWGAAVFAAVDREECTENEAARLVRSFITAGFDTTINGLGNLIYALAEAPDQWDRLKADPMLARKAIEESLRWASTVQTFFRTTTCDIDIEGSIIPESSKVLLMLGAANRDPRRWEDPDRFDITRQASGHVAFGFGIHQCLGQMVARQEAEVILAAMSRRIKSFHLAAIPKRRLNNTLYALASLPIEVVKE